MISLIACIGVIFFVGMCFFGIRVIAEGEKWAIVLTVICAIGLSGILIFANMDDNKGETVITVTNGIVTELNEHHYVVMVGKTPQPRTDYNITIQLENEEIKTFKTDSTIFKQYKEGDKVKYITEITYGYYTKEISSEKEYFE